MNDTKATYDVFLSYNSEDHASVEAVARHLEKQGLTVFLDRWYLVAGISWIQKLEETLSACRAVAIFLGPHGIGGWQQRERELALDRQASTPAFPVIPVLLQGADPALGFLSLNTWVDLRSGYDDISLAFLITAIQGKPPGPELQSRRADALASICPYRGLRFFREEDAPFFFGRDEFIDRLAGSVNQHTLVAVVGASGSGKSSVVRAGLAPRLRSRAGRLIWDIAMIVPGDRPLQNLAAVMVPFLEPGMTEIDRLKEVGKLAASFRAGEIRLRDAVSRALEKQPGTDRLMLVVDQWEELYTLTSDESIRERFLGELLDATSSGALSVILTLRSEFFDKLISYRPLSDRLQGDAIVHVSGMTRNELEEIVEGPAAKVGLQFEPGLAKQLLDEVVGQPGSLPLLEFALTELWRESRQGFLTHKGYEEIGEIEGAIAVHAEDLFGKLTQGEQVIARRVFLQLIRPGEVGSASPNGAAVEVKSTRRRATFGELGQGNLPVVLKLADAHLIVTGRNDATGEEIVDLVHEALIEKWDRLKSWIQEDYNFLTWRDRLRTLMNIATAGRHGRSFLLRGSLLAEARKWLWERNADLSTAEKLYIQRSMWSRKWQIAWIIMAVVPILILGVYLYKNVKPGKGRGAVIYKGPSADSSPPDGDASSTEESPLAGVDNLGLLPAKVVKLPAEPVKIPVVVHVVYRTQPENISDEQIRSQIAVLNKDFRARNDDLSNVPAPFKGVIGDARVEFSLASIDPQGRSTNGITRTKTTQEFLDGDERLYFYSRGGADAWPAERYLNIWVGNLGEKSRGYAQFPGGRKEIDGVVSNYANFGTIGTARAPFNLGRQVTHDIGHYLGLHHLWGEKAGCKGTDFVNDTPQQEQPNFGRPRFPHITCNNGPNGDMFMNFMDDTDDDAKCMFTKGQVLRMHQVLQGSRRELVKSANQRAAGGVVHGDVPSIRVPSKINLKHAQGSAEIGIRLVLDLSGFQENIGVLVDSVPLPSDTCANPGQNVVVRIWKKNIAIEGDQATFALAGDVDIWNCIDAMGDRFKTRLVQQPFDLKMPFRMFRTPQETVQLMRGDPTPTMVVDGSLGKTGEEILATLADITEQTQRTLDSFVQPDLCKAALPEPLAKLAPKLLRASLLSDSGHLAAVCEMRASGGDGLMAELVQTIRSGKGKEQVLRGRGH